MSEDQDQSQSAETIDPEHLGGINPETVREVAHLLDAGRDDLALKQVEGLHAADIADLVEQLPGDLGTDLAQALSPEETGDVLAELEEGQRDELIKAMEPEAVAEAVAQLDTDDAVYVLEDLGERKRAEILDKMELPNRQSLTEALSYPEESAGRLMQRNLIAVPAFWTVGQVIDYMREADDLPDEFYQIFVIDPGFKPVGSVRLDRLARTRRPVQIGDIQDDKIRTINVALDREEVGFLFNQYDLVAAPVVDDDGRLVGVITVDDVVEIVQEEVEEDILRLAGVGEEAVSDSIKDTVRSRFTWLTVNLGTAILASAVIALFEATIEQIVALAVLMPIVASMGGNAGTQTLTVAVRALATHDLTAANAARIVWREVVVGGINGIAFAILMGLVAGLWYKSAELGGVIAMAMIINMLVAGLSGILVPMGLDRLKIDPAVASSVFVTTVTDVVGFFAFLGLAALVLL